MANKPPDKGNERQKTGQLKNNNATHDRNSENRPRRPSRPTTTPAGPSRESSSRPNRKQKSVRINLPPTTRKSGENGGPIRHTRGPEPRVPTTAARRSTAGASYGPDGKRIIVFTKSRYKIYEKPKHSEFGRALSVIQSDALTHYSRERTRSGTSRAGSLAPSIMSVRTMDYSRKSLILDASGESKPNKYLNDSELPKRFRKDEAQRTGDLKKKYLVPPDLLKKWPSSRGFPAQKWRRRQDIDIVRAGTRTQSKERSVAWSKPRLEWLEKIEKDSPQIEVLSEQQKKAKVKEREFCCCPFTTLLIFARERAKVDDYYEKLAKTTQKL